MTNLYQNNTRGFTPYASCNINHRNGCELDSRCTLFQQCTKLAAEELEQSSNGNGNGNGIRPHIRMTPYEFAEHKTAVADWLNSNAERIQEILSPAEAAEKFHQQHEQQLTKTQICHMLEVPETLMHDDTIT
jgi:hypothetical protein